MSNIRKLIATNFREENKGASEKLDQVGLGNTPPEMKSIDLELERISAEHQMKCHDHK